MKIRKVSHWTERFSLKQPYTIAYETIASVDSQIVRIETESGLAGMGAASPAPSVTGERITDCQAALNAHLESILTDGDLRHLNTLLRRVQTVMPETPAARAAVDMALYDVVAKHLDMPVVDFLGRAHDCLPTSVTLGIASTKESVAKASACVKKGFRILKIKLGKSLEQDVERLRKIREEVGTTVNLRVDINQGYTVAAFKDFIKRTESLDLAFFEQPLMASEWQRMRAFPAAVRRKTAADESLIGPADALRFSCPPQPFGIYNIKLMKCGGILPALQIATIANLAGVGLMWGCNDESSISISAALHAALASPATRYLDLDGSFDIVRDLAEGGFVLESGQLRVTGKPGLGITSHRSRP